MVGAWLLHAKSFKHFPTNSVDLQVGQAVQPTAEANTGGLGQGGTADLKAWSEQASW